MSWASATIGDICEIVNGGTPKTGVSSYWDGEHMWITPAEMGRRATPYVAETKRRLTSAGLDSTNLLPPYSVILSSRAPIGHLVINTVPMATNQGCKGLVPSSQIDHKFLFYYLSSIVPQLNELGTGTTFKELSGGSLKKVPIQFPLLSEQKRIVALLDEAFEGLDRARFNAEANFQNAKELFGSFLGEIFAQPASVWREASLQEIVEPDCTLSYGIVQPGDEFANGLPLVRPTDLNKRIISLEGLKRIDPARAEGYGRTKLKGGEILFCVRGSTGVISLASEALKGGNVTRGIVPVRFAPAAMQQRLGYYQFLSKPVQDQIRAGTYGAALMQINISDVRRIKFSVPPPEQQDSLIERLDSVASNFDLLVEGYEQKIVELDNLRQSILQSAFTGKLTFG